MSDWDDDDFEVDVKQIEEKKVQVVEDVEEVKPEELPPPKAQPSKARPKGKSALNTFTNDLDRELTESEKMEMQRRSDLSFAQELFGTKEEGDLTQLENVVDFKRFGEEIGEKLIARANSVYYVDMISALLRTATTSMEANKLRLLSTQLKNLADDKTVKEKEEKKPKGKTAAAKPTLKGGQKASAKISVDDYGDYGFAPDSYDIEEDFM